MKTSLAVLAAALVAAPAALADGPPQYAAQYGAGVARGTTHYVALPVGTKRTMLTVIRAGYVGGNPTFRGSFGIPMTTYSHADGLSRDGKLLFLQSTSFGAPTRFLVVSTKTLKRVDGFSLNGSFSFDALSPDASRLYLIERQDADFSRYVVRAYDLRTHRLLPGRIADRTQKSWVMQGTAVTRTATTDGRWVYTLYMNGGGYPFIHALDTVRGVAHCIGLPWTASQDALWRFTLSVHGSALAVDTGKKHLYRIDRSSWRLSTPHGGGFPGLWVALSGLALLLAGGHTLRRLTGGRHDPTARTRILRVLRGGARGARRLPVTVRGAGR